MEVIRCWEEKGETISDPYRRTIKVFLASDKRNVPEITFTHALIYPHSKTDYHEHDRPELIQVLSGRGVSICDGKETPLEPDTVLWVRAHEMHQVVNTGNETLKLATVFVPSYTSEQLLGGIRAAAEKAKKKSG